MTDETKTKSRDKIKIEMISISRICKNRIFIRVFLIHWNDNEKWVKVESSTRTDKSVFSTLMFPPTTFYISIRMLYSCGLWVASSVGMVLRIGCTEWQIFFLEPEKIMPGTGCCLKDHQRMWKNWGKKIRKAFWSVSAEGWQR